MTKSDKIYIAFALGLLALIAVFSVGHSRGQSLGSVAVGNDYKSLEITSATSTVVKTATGSFGSIVIASSTTVGSFAIYDNAQATSSATSTRVVMLKAQATPGTYTFDRDMLKGIIVEASAGFNGAYVITYR